jgi:hypothetical protein
MTTGCTTGTSVWGRPMPKFDVYFKGTANYKITVEAEDDQDALNVACDEFEDTPSLCLHCSGYSREWSLEIPDDRSCWEVTEAFEVNGPETGPCWINGGPVERLHRK